MGGQVTQHVGVGSSSPRRTRHKTGKISPLPPVPHRRAAHAIRQQLTAGGERPGVSCMSHGGCVKAMGMGPVLWLCLVQMKLAYMKTIQSQARYLPCPSPLYIMERHNHDINMSSATKLKHLPVEQAQPCAQPLPSGASLAKLAMYKIMPLR